MSINVPTEKAKAVIDALEREMMDKIATKADLDHLKEVLSQEILATKADFTNLRELVSRDIQNQTNAMTVRLILTAVGLVPAIVAAQKLF